MKLENQYKKGQGQEIPGESHANGRSVSEDIPSLKNKDMHIKHKPQCPRQTGKDLKTELQNKAIIPNSGRTWGNSVYC